MVRVALTGHRPGVRLNEQAAADGMVNIIHRLLEQDSVTVLTGGSAGADRLWWDSAWLTATPHEVYVPRGYKEHYKLGDWFDDMLRSAADIHWTQFEGKPYDWRLNFSRNTDMVNGSTMGVVCTDVHPTDLIGEAKGGTRHAATLMWGRNRREGYDVLWLNSLSGEVKRIWTK